MKRLLLLTLMGLTLVLTSCTKNTAIKVVGEAPKLFGFESLKSNYNLGEKAPDWLAGIQAFDQEDGSITNLITVDASQVDMNKIGKYTVRYTIKDSASNIVTKNLDINVGDFDAPIVTGFNDIEITLNLQNKPNFLKNIIIKDNIDEIALNEIKVDDSLVQYHIPGDYEVKYEVSDKSDNKTKFSIIVTVLNEDQSNTKEVKKYYPVEMTKEGFQLINVIGFGYNSAKYQYVNVSSISTSFIFDTDWLNTIQLNKTNIAKATLPSVYTARSYNGLIAQLEDPSSYETLKKTNPTEFENNSTFDKQFFYMIDHKEYKYMLEMPEAFQNDYKDHLDSVFIMNLEKLQNNDSWMTFERFFNAYGTHVILGGIFGGRIQTFCAIQSNNDLINPSACTKYTKAIMEKTDISYIMDPVLGDSIATFSNSISIGGMAMFQSFREYDDWVDSLNDQAILIEFPNEALIPIWEVLPENYSNLKEQMKIEYEKYVNSKKIS